MGNLGQLITCLSYRCINISHCAVKGRELLEVEGRAGGRGGGEVWLLDIPNAFPVRVSSETMPGMSVTTDLVLLQALYKRSSAVTASHHLSLHVQEQIHGPSGLNVCLIVLNAFPFIIRCIPSGQNII